MSNGLDNCIRASIWTRQETLLLLDLWEQETRRQNLDGTARNYKVHQRISQVLNSRGYSRSPMQVRERLKRLRREYRESRRCEYYDRIAAIMTSQPETNGGAVGSPAENGTESHTNGNGDSRMTDDDAGLHVNNDDRSQGTSDNDAGSPTELNGHQTYAENNKFPQHAPPVTAYPDINHQADNNTYPSYNSTDESLILQRRTVHLLTALVEGQRRTQRSTVCYQRQMLQNMHIIATSMQTVAGSLARACLYTPLPARGEDDGGGSPTYAASLLEQQESYLDLSQDRMQTNGSCKEESDH
ncbi:uncharacterized protein LOC135395322 isoform X2 [Ornithodoros turicata]